MNATYIYENGSLVLNGLDNGVGTYVTGSGMRRAVNVYTPSVKDYGALGNGIADDCMAFNWALGNATNVYVPPGTYIIGCSIVPPSGRTLYGDPGTATLKRIASASSSFDTISGSAAGTHDITISGLVIDGNYQQQTFQDYSGLEFNDLTSTSSNVRVTNCAFINNSNGTGQAILIAGWSGVQVSANTITGGGGPLFSSGLYCRRSSVISVTNNHIYDYGGTGIHFVSATVGELGYALTVTGNIIERCSGRGLVLSDVNSGVIGNNIINQTGYGFNSPNGEFGILISFTNGGSNDVVVSNNVVYDNVGICMAVFSSTLVSLVGNEFSKCGTANIMLRGSPVTNVLNNMLYNPADTVLRPYAGSSMSAVALITLNAASSNVFISGNRLQSSAPTNVSVPQYSIWTDGSGSSVTMGVNVLSSSNMAAAFRFNSSTDQLLGIQLPNYLVSQLPTCGTAGTAANMLAWARDAYTSPAIPSIVFCDSSSSTWRRTNDLRSVGSAKVFYTTDSGVFLGTGAALATSATTPYTYFQTWKDTPTGVPSADAAGYKACGVDTTNNKWCCYNSGWKCAPLT